MKRTRTSWLLAIFSALSFSVFSLTVSAAPDLIVEAPEASDSTLFVGQAFGASATVRNQGNMNSGPTTLRYFRSSNSLISTADFQIGTSSVPSLAAGATSKQGQSVSIGANGTFWIGSCVDSVANESPTNNQCSSGVQVTVTTPTPDLIVESPSVSSTTLVAGQTFNVSAIVRNQGNGPSAATTLRYYRSSNSFISAADTEIGTSSVPIVAAAAASNQTQSVSIGAEGTYWIGSCVDAVAGESPTNNQCSSGVQVSVTTPTPDLIVESPSVSSTTLVAGQTFNVSAIIRNQGNSGSATTTLRYYRSTNSFISIGDTEIGTSSVPILAADATSNQIQSVSIGAEGTYWIGSCVDAVAGESPTTNQCSTGVQVVVIAATRDLIVESPSVSDTTLTVGQTFNASAIVRNQGNSDSATTTLRYFRSSNSLISNGDFEIGTSSVPILAADATSNQSQLVSIGAAGTYWIGSCVDAVAGESPTTNQCSTGVPVVATMLAPDAFEPDDTVMEAMPISKNAVQVRTLHVPGDEDWISFNLESAVANLVVETMGDIGGDTVLRIYDASNQEIAFNDDSGFELYSKIEQATLPAGQYFILVNELNVNATLSEYTITLEYEPDDDLLLFLPAIIKGALERKSK